MYLQKIHLHHVRIPLRVVFAQANQHTQTSDSVILRVQTRDGAVGYGESCPRTYVSGEDVQQVIKAINEWQEELWKTPFDDLETIYRWTLRKLDQGAGPAAVCAVELALIDTWCHENQMNIMDALASEWKTDLPYSGVLPYGSWTTLSKVIAPFQLDCWKFKATANIADNRERIQQIKTLKGTGISLRTDANGGWSPENAANQIRMALNEGLSSFEQPLLPAQNDQMSALMQTYGNDARLMADESLVSFGDAQHLIADGFFNHFNLKISKNGGLFNTWRIYQLAAENGIACQLGAHYGETSILTAAGAAFTAMANRLTAVEGGMGTFLLQDDLTSQPLMMNTMGQLQGINDQLPGWPVAIDDLKLCHYSIATHMWEKRPR